MVVSETDKMTSFSPLIKKRRAIRVSDLFSETIVHEKINNIVNYHNVWLKFSNHETVDPNSIIESLLRVSKNITYFVDEIWKVLDIHNIKKSKILFEGAQGVMLDIDHGTYPYVTSSNTVSGQAFVGSGASPQKIEKILGVIKAYTTRVGSGPFPTELNNSIGDHLIDKGKEFGTVTKRKRRCGWFDAILVKQSVILNGINEIVLTKLDVLDELEKIDVCVGYKINGKHYDYLPLDEVLQGKIEPIYKSLKGWKQKTYGIQDWKDLPVKAKEYIEFLEKTIQKNISIISTGPDRKETIDKNNILSNI